MRANISSLDSTQLKAGLEVEDETIAAKSAWGPRKGWSEQFQAMAENNDDHLLDPEVTLPSSDQDEWEW